MTPFPLIEREPPSLSPFPLSPITRGPREFKRPNKCRITNRRKQSSREKSESCIRIFLSKLCSATALRQSFWSKTIILGQENQQPQKPLSYQQRNENENLGWRKNIYRDAVSSLNSWGLQKTDKLGKMNVDTFLQHMQLLCYISRRVQVNIFKNSKASLK